MIDIRELNRNAIRGCGAVVDQLRPTDMGRPTPCAGWKLTDLMAHMEAQHRGFAAAARGDGHRLDVWELRKTSCEDAVASYLAAADDVMTAFAEDGVLERRFTLPEISSELTFQAERAIGFHLVDYVVHGWDVARSLGATYAPDPAAVEAALDITVGLPDGPERLTPGAAFAPGRGADPTLPALDRMVAMLGRSPTWPR